MQGNARQPSQARTRPSTSGALHPRLRPSSPSRFTAAPTMAAVLVLGLVASILHLSTPAHAYIPAVPVNDTSSLDSSSDLLHLAFQNGVYNTPISRQLWAEGFDDSGNYTNISTIVPWTKFSKGVLLHFDETLRNQPPTSVPWIAMISCDTNGTNPSDEDDIFTITRDLGAQAALLYSLTSEGCQITEEYLTTFEKVLDVYATTTLQGSRIIEQQFVNVNAAAAEYDSLTLNNSASIAQALLDSNALSVIGNVPINASSTVTDDEGGETAMSTVDPTAIAAATSPSVFDPDNDGSTSSSPDALVTSSATAPSLFSGTSAAAGRLVRRQAAPTVPTGSPPTRTSSSASATSTALGTSQNYLGAVMAAANVTVGGLNPPSASASATSGGGGGGATSTSMAMIILYALVGVVTALFLVVVMSGAIRAARHPERYGPRPGGVGGQGGSGGGEGQTRASGLTRAILDTFPVVKFGNGGAQNEERRDEEAGPLGGGGDDDDERKKAAAAAGQGEQIELAVMPTMAPAIPMARSSSADGPAPRGVPPVAAPVAAAEARPRAASRASTSAESFHSAASTPAAVPVARRHSTSSLEPLPATTSSATASGTPTAPDPAAAPVAAVSPSQAAVEATLASAADAAEADLCPICFCDFEDGDELRVLPCDNRHRFHSACIDPFLLNVSRLCPLCRLDLATVAAPGAASTNDAQQQQQQQQDGEGAPRTSEGEGSAEGERHEEERVIRHLRALLHRGSHSSPAGSARPTVPGASSPSTSAGAAGAAGAESADGVDGLDGGAAGFRNRFASYVTARRGRTRRGSSFSGPSRLGSSFSAWAAGPSGDGRIGAPV
ncbi:hypothetical protein JCM8208_006996 [Rhodotorula glutinis]